MLITHILLYQIKENFENYHRLSFFVKKKKIKETLDVQIFVFCCYLRLHNNILNLLRIFSAAYEFLQV